MKKWYLAAVLPSVLLSFMFAKSVSAASLYASISRDTVAIGDTLQVDLKIDSEGTGVNAAQATVQFPKDILEVSSLDKGGSVFNFWLEEPAFSNADGKVTLVGGTISGISGKSLQVVRIQFKVKGSGNGEIAITDGAVTASDGSGTNVLSAMLGAQISSVPRSGIVAPTPGTPTSPTAPVVTPTPTPLPVVTSTPPVVEIPPQQIIRPPEQIVVAKNLPAKPDLEVQLFPDQTAWYNLSAQFFVNWELPGDVSGIADDIDKQPNFEPSRSKGLYDSKSFRIIDDGVWYLHVRFRNNVGWGPTAHYRLALDRTPPLPFEVTVKEGESTDYPTPTVSYSTGDELSGLKGYTIRVDNGDPIETKETVYTLPKLDPGHHTIRVGARDNADNFTESMVAIDILPIESPIVTEISDQLFLGEGKLELQGTSLPDATILVVVKQASGDYVGEVTAVADSNGNWRARFDQPLKKGVFAVDITAEDGRGAKSLVVTSEGIRVRERPLMTIAGIEITQFRFFIGLIIALLASFGAGFMSYRLWRKQMGYRVTLAARDVTAAFGQIGKDVDKCLAYYSDRVIDPKDAQDMEFLLKKIRTGLDKTKKYVVENIEEIRD